MYLKNKILKIKSSKDVLRILIYSIYIINIVFALVSYILGIYGVYFRQAIINFIYLNNGTLVVATVLCLFTESESSIGSVIVRLVCTVIGLFIIFIMFFTYVFFVDDERPFYMEGKKFICSFQPGFDEDTAMFYKPINMVTMKKIKDDGLLTHNNNLYSSDNFEFIKVNKVDLIGDDFARLNPLAAKKQFKKSFKYIGNHSYDFGVIIIKFDNTESYVKEAFIKGDIFSYEGKSIKVIGQNVKCVKDEIEKIYNYSDVILEYPKNYILEYK